MPNAVEERKSKRKRKKKFVTASDAWKHDSKPKKDDDGVCVVCMDNAASVVYFPCKHLICCVKCTVRTQLLAGRCAVCNAVIEESHAVYKA